MALVPKASASLVVIDPSGRQARVPLAPLPFRMGRAPDNNLVVRDSRVSRAHAQITDSDGSFVLEDLGSRHGVWVDGQRIEKSRTLAGFERIEFGVPDGYQVHFTRTGDELQRLLNTPPPEETSRSGTANLEKLRAVLEARAQGWPARIVRLLVGFPPGGGMDSAAPRRERERIRES